MKQIIPCNVEMYAIYNCMPEENIRERVLAFGLDESGHIRPLVFDDEVGVCDAEALENFERYEIKERDLIADALEGIEVNLTFINDLLDGLSGYAAPSPLAPAGTRGTHFLRIRGDVDIN